MAYRFVDSFQIKTLEQKQIVLMLCTGFFMGVFIATYQVTADSLFLNRMGDSLNRAFLIAGSLGIVTTALFSFFQNRIKFTTLTLSSVLLIFVFPFLLKDPMIYFNGLKYYSAAALSGCTPASHQIPPKF